MEKRLVKYFYNGEWHYASVKDIGDLDMLNTFEKDTIVDAINSIVQNGEITNETTITNLNKISEKVRLVDEKIDNHIANRNNPHGVTAEQVDTYTKAVIDSKTSNALTSSKTYTDGKISYLDTKITTHINDTSNPHNVTAEQVNTYTKEVIDKKSQSILADAKSYIDSIKDYILDLINKTKQALQDYTYPKVTIDSKDTSILGTAKSYTDTTKAEIIAGNVYSATKLQTARAINGVYFDGTKDITLSADSLNTYNKQEVDAKVEDATTISRDYTNEREVVVNEYTDNQIINAKSAVLADSKKYTDAEVLKAKNEIKAGNVYSATKLQTPRNINGVAFDGTKDITLSVDNIGTYSKADIDSKDANVLGQAKAYVDSVRTAINGTISDSVANVQNQTYTKTEIDGKDSATLSSAKNYTDTSVSSAKTELNNNIAREKANIIAGNVASATKLQTARNINGVAFDGTKDISISAGQVGAYTKSEADSKISEKIGEIEIGGRNILRGTKDMKLGSGKWVDGTWRQSNTGVTKNVTLTDFPLANITQGVEITSDSSECGIAQDFLKMEKGKYTLSYYVKAKTSGIQVRLQTYWNNNNQSSAKTVTLTGTGWQRISMTSELLTDETQISAGYIYVVSPNSTIIVAAPFEHRSNKEGEWNQAPEDMATKQDIITTLSQVNAYSDTKKTEANSYTDSEITQLRTNTYTKSEVDTKDTNILNSARSYSDTKKTEANSYTDTEIGKVKTIISGLDSSSVGTYSKTEIDTKDTTTLNSAKSYADGKATSVQNNLNGHTNNRSNPHGVTAEQVGAYTKAEVDSLIGKAKSSIATSSIGTYTKSEIDTKDTNTLNSAKSYTDSNVNTVQENLNAHTGNKSNPHGVTASQVGAYSKGETYSRAEVDSKVNGVVSNLNTYSRNEIDTKDTGALNSAKNYTDDLRNHVIFVGTKAQWNALGTTEQNKYILKAIVE